ncbi:MAG: ABC transporter ATP-binding protein [Methanomassiliicoccales archaeon]|nr:ABC transporter ATP-binding protein [Methanomassiliicoccales archaeon]NYT14452.1 ABC transporter ATP-binding protein [Methanomassiliicoccales archaeon]
MPEIILEDITVTYGKIQAMKELNIEVKDGEYLCLLGPTGAGKTTTLRVICGLTTPSSGRVLFDGKDITDTDPEERRATMLSQTYSLFPHMTVEKNIAFGPEIRNWDENVRKEAVSSMLDLVRLTKRADAYPKELSGGMQQRNALARALASGAQVLLLDEPLRALDARLRLDLRQELRSLAKSLNITTVHVTHDQDEALVMADRIAVIREGGIIQVGAPREVFENPRSPFVANFIGQSNFITGVVKQTGETTVLEDRAGRSLPGMQSVLDLEEKAVISMKIGQTSISKTEPGFLEGEIERLIFEGRFVHVDMQVDDIGRFSCKIPPRKMDEFQSGDIVQISWEPSKATIFPYPKDGLENELRVE